MPLDIRLAAELRRGGLLCSGLGPWLGAGCSHFSTQLKIPLESANIGVAAAFQACKIAVVIEALNQRSARQQNNGVRTDAALLSDKAQAFRRGGLHRDPFNR